MSEEKYTYVTMTRDESEPTYKFAEIKYGKIVSINSHWVPLEEYRKFFAADSFFIDITIIPNIYLLLLLDVLFQLYKIF